MAWLPTIDDLTGETVNKAGQEYDKVTGLALKNYQNTIDQNTGTQGYATALNQARNNANQGAQNQTASATNQAIQAAQQAGMSKASAAMNAGNTAANTYSQAYATSLSSQQNLMQNYQAMAVSEAGNIYSEKVKQATIQYQKKLEDYNQKMQRVQQIVQLAMKAGSMVAGKFGGGAKGTKADYDTSLTGGSSSLAKWTTGMGGSGLSGGTGYSNGFYSDVRLKEGWDDDKASEPPSAYDRFFDKLNAIKFQYTPEAQEELGLDDDKHVGLSAQEVESSGPIGKDIVEEDLNGNKMLNQNKLIEATAAGLASLRKELGLSSI